MGESKMASKNEENTIQYFSTILYFKDHIKITQQIDEKLNTYLFLSPLYKKDWDKMFPDRCKNKVEEGDWLRNEIKGTMTTRW